MTFAAGNRCTALAALVMLVFAAGCMESDDGESSAADSDAAEDLKPRPPPARRPAAPMPAPAFNFQQLSLTDCRVYGSVNDLPHAFFPRTTPDSWSDANPIPLSVLRYWLIDCARFSWGSFERGPFQLVREDHSHFTAPQSCREGDYREPYVASQWMVSDPEVAEGLSERWGVPVGVVKASHSGPGGPAANVYNVQWSSSDVFGASLNWYAQGPNDNRISMTDRYYSLHEDGLVALDWTEDFTQASNPEELPLANGTMGPGSLYHQMLGENYVAAGDVFFDVDITTTIAKYGDLECLQVVG